MNLGRFSISRGVTTSMAYLCMVGFGLYSLYNLPINQLPEVELPVIAVITNYTGASPENIETLLTEPIERAVASSENVEHVRSRSSQGSSLVIISFTWGTDMDMAEVEIRRNLELFAEDFLPAEASRPLTFAFDPGMAPVMFLALDGPLDGHQLRELATEQVQPYLNRIEGVAAAEVMGGLDREIQVRVHPRWLQTMGIGPTQVVDALRAANLVTPSGAIQEGGQLLNLQPTSEFRTLAQIENVTVGMRGPRPVLLHEVAEVVDAFEEETHVLTANGEPAVMIAVRKQSDANTVQVARGIRDALPEIQEQLPNGVNLVTFFDESRSILRAVANLGRTGFGAFILTGLVLLVFLRSTRTSLISMVAIPISVVVAFVVMDALGVTLNLISLAGLALAIGMLVDNAIVVLETTFQYLEEGKKPARAALMAAEEMAMPLFASTMTTVVVFLPILLVEGIAGELFRDMVLTICVSLLSSLVVALSLVPLLASRLLARNPLGSRSRTLLTRLTAPIDRLPERYEKALAVAVRHPKKIIFAAFLAFVGSLACVPLLGQDYLPRADVSEVRLELHAAPGISLEEMRERVRMAEQVIQEQVPEASVTTADFGAGEGFAAIFGGSTNVAKLTMRLSPPAERTRSQQQIEEVLAAHLPEIPGVRVKIQSTSMGGNASDVSIKVFGDHLQQVSEYAEGLQNALRDVDGIREMRFSVLQGSPELSLDYDRERMRTLGIAPAVVASTVATYYQGTVATVFRENGREYMIRVRAPREARESLDMLRYLPVMRPDGSSVPLESLVTIGDRLGPVAIEREDQRRYATLDITRAEAVDLGTLTQRVEAVIESYGRPEGIQVEVGGAAEDLRDAFIKLAMALAAALILVYMVMASQFESLLEPFVIMATVPLAIIGVVLGLFVTGTSLQVTAMVGVILLGGVVVNNGIVLIDLIKRIRATGVPLAEAIVEGGRKRMRPILMTALTTILGMVPLSVGVGDGAETWAPMARAVVGGMAVSTLLTLFVVPCFYLLVASFRERWRLDRARLTPVPPAVARDDAQEAAQ